MQTLKLTKKYEKYPEYKDSGVEWFGKVPKDWQVGPLRSVLVERVEKNKKLVTDNILSVMKDVGVIRYADKGDVGNKSSDRPENYKIVHAGDIVLNSMNLVIGSVGQSKELGVTSSVYIIYYPRNKEIFADYYHYLFRNKSWQKTLGRLGKGIMELRESINSDLLKIEPVPIPPLNQQKAIVAFLDEKTSYIDQIIEKKQRLIGLLKEKRIAVINHAVTRGLDPKVELKDSGIEWIGKIPKGWKMSSLKTLLKMKITDGPHTTPTLLEDGIGFISAESIQANNTIDFNKNRGFISRDDHIEFCKKAHPQRDDVFMVKSGATTGRVAIVETDSEFSIWSPLALIRADINKALPKYIYFFLQSGLFQDQIRFSWSFGTQQNIGMRVIENLAILYPSSSTQKEIVEYLESRMPNFDLAIQKVEKSIQALQEFKSSLISNVVTGKIKV